MMEHIKTRLLPYDPDEIFGRWAYRCGDIEEVFGCAQQVDLWSEGTVYSVVKHRLNRNQVLKQMAKDMVDGTMPYVFKNLHSLRVESIYVPYLNLYNKTLIALNSTIMTIDNGKFFRLPASIIVNSDASEAFNPEVIGGEDRVLGMNISRHDAELYANDLGCVIAPQAAVVMVPMWRVSFIAYDGAHSFYMIDGAASKDARAISPKMPVDDRLIFKPYGNFKLFRVIISILIYFMVLTVFISCMVNLDEAALQFELPQETLAIAFTIVIVTIGILLCYIAYGMGCVVDRIYTFFKRIHTKNKWKRYCEKSLIQKRDDAHQYLGVKLD